MNRVTICRAKCLNIVTLKVLPTSYFRYNSEEKSTKSPNPKMKPNKIDLEFPCASSLTKFLEDFEKMTGF